MSTKTSNEKKNDKSSVTSAKKTPAATINKSDLVNLFAEKQGMTKIKATELLDTLYDIIADSLKKDHTVIFGNIGRLKISHRKETVGRNPRTGEQLKIAARKKVTFTIASQFLTVLNPTGK